MNEERFYDKVDGGPGGGCHLWTGAVLPFGYGRFYLDGKARLAHRVAWKMKNGPVPDGLCVLHHCDCPACVNTDHLFLGTYADNAFDRNTKGRQMGARGELNSHAKLTRSDVSEIRDLCENGAATQKVIGSWYGVSDVAVSLINIRKTWRYVH